MSEHTIQSKQTGHNDEVNTMTTAAEVSEFGQTNDEKRSRAAIDRVRGLMDPRLLAAADRLAAVNGRYVPITRDKPLLGHLKALVASVTAPPTGKPDKRRILAVVGKSGAGKTTALAEHISRIPEMQAYRDEDGIWIHPTIFIEAPSPCTPRLLAIAGLEALGHAPPDRIRENEAWLLFRRLLKVHKVMFVVIDECQNAIETASVRQATVIGDAFKHLTQMSDWPVRLILAGVPPLASFLARKQLYNRRTVIPFDSLDTAGNQGLLSEVLRIVIEDHANLEMGEGLDDEDFRSRLLHAVDAEFGSGLQMIRAAVERAVLADRPSVTKDDFKAVYASFSGCKPTMNVFDAPDWAELDPATALLRAEDRAWEEERKRTKGKKATIRSVRPQ